MWEGGGHEAAAAQLMPWFGTAASAFVADPAAAGFGFGFEAAVATAPVSRQQRGGVAAAEEEGLGGGGGKAVVSGLLGSLQAELGRVTAREMMEAKALAASRSHSEAERRRRQRINGHLARLRSLLPNTTKTDKASLLAEVIEHVKELKRQTTAIAAAGNHHDDVDVDDEDGMCRATSQQLLPTEADELAVDAAVDGEGRLVVRASLCCEDRPDLIPDIARALAALRLRARRAEITTLGGRVRSVLLITADEHVGRGDDDVEEDDDDDEDECTASHRRHECIATVQEALRGVMDRRAAASSDTSTSSGAALAAGGGGSIKRQRMNYGGQDHQCSV
uniref:BHLH domain-containing protein n=1 Tax=Leersia perrieri TaxID=77586 RepID=A0A0D9XDM3_9ORYZ